MSLQAIREQLRAQSDETVAVRSLRFFKTGKGDYGEGDCFLGLRVPVLRQSVRQFEDIDIATVFKVLDSRWHEERLFALFLLVRKFNKGNAAEREQIYTGYLVNTRYVNNWDLVDSSAYHIVGPYLQDKSRKPLDRLAASKNLWERRIAIIATLHYIRQKDFADTLRLAEKLLHDEHDLIHKAVGWMLREVGNRDLAVEGSFLKVHYKSMPRTMLRYAIEKLPEKKRRFYLDSSSQR